MKVMILAAGKGKRLYPLAVNKPKPMMPVGGRPVLEHVISNLSDQGFKEIIVNLHHLPEVITSYFDDGKKFGVKIKYSFEKELLGTAGAVKKMEDEFDETFIVVYGDNLCRFKFQDLIDFHQAKKPLVTIVFITGTDPTGGGIAEIDNDDRVIKFVEKPGEKVIFSPWINAGIYIIEPRILTLIPANDFFDFGKDLFPFLIRFNKRVCAYRSNETLQGINTVDEYSRAQNLFGREHDP